MVGKTGRKCPSQGINVIAGGSKCMEDLYKASLPQKSSKFDRYIHHIVPAPIRGYKIWDWVYLALKKALGFPLGVRERLLRDFVAFAEINGIGGTISAQVAFDWACSASERCGVSGKATRLSVARQFLFHLSAAVPGI